MGFDHPETNYSNGSITKKKGRESAVCGLESCCTGNHPRRRGGLRARLLHDKNRNLIRLVSSSRVWWEYEAKFESDYRGTDEWGNTICLIVRRPCPSPERKWKQVKLCHSTVLYTICAAVFTRVHFKIVFWRSRWQRTIFKYRCLSKKKNEYFSVHSIQYNTL